MTAHWWNTDTTYVFGDKNKIYLSWGRWGYASPEKKIGPFTFTLTDYGLKVEKGSGTSALVSAVFGGDITLASGVPYKKYLEIKKLPLARRHQSSGGVITTVRYERQYPYGELARRTLGYIKKNDDGNSAKGIEGSFNYELHGTDGIEWTKLVDL